VLVLRLELHSVKTGEVTELGRMHIANKGDSKNPAIGNYNVAVMRAPKFQRRQRESTVDNYRRKTRPVWDLVALALHRMGYGR
jgi:hypothetical protein